VKVADFSIARAGTGEDAGRTGELLAAGGYLAPEAQDGAEPDGRADVYGLGACLFEMLTGRSPATMQHRGGNGALSPRAVLAGVPRELDSVVLKATMVDPRDRYQTAAAMGSDLAGTAARDGDRTSLVTPRPLEDVPLPDDTQQAPGFLRHEGRWLGWTLVVVGLVAALVVVGASLNSTGVINFPGTHQTPQKSPETTARAAAPLKIVTAQAFDPFGSPSDEHNADAPKAVDGDPQTTWETERYRTSDFGSLKPGVGIVLDLGSPKQARKLKLELTNGGSSIEIYGSDSMPESFDGSTQHQLARLPDASRDATLDFAGDASYQYYLVWFTRLPSDPDGGFQDGIAEATLRP
jgi:eukaryotic-like serine/threonine-protein kinase